MKRLEIYKYKCFNDFSIDDISNINLIVGTPNVGKSVLLSYIHLITKDNSEHFNAPADSDMELNDVLSEHHSYIVETVNKIFNENIEKIQFRSGGYEHSTVFLRKGTTKFVRGGTGMSTVVSLLLFMFSDKEILLIDGIEYSLHPSIIKPVLRMLFKEIMFKDQIIDGKKQLFMTTHSKDVLKAVESIIQADKRDETNFESKDEFINTFRCHALVIDKNNISIRKCFTYKPSQFLATMTTSFDIRGELR